MAPSGSVNFKGVRENRIARDGFPELHERQLCRDLQTAVSIKRL